MHYLTIKEIFRVLTDIFYRCINIWSLNLVTVINLNLIMVEELNQILNMEMEGTPENEAMPKEDMPMGNDTMEKDGNDNVASTDASTDE